MSPTFDPHELGWHLAAVPSPRLDDTHGEGYRYALGPYPEEPQADLEVYPQAKLVRYSSEGLTVTLKDGDLGAHYGPDGVLFDSRGEREHRTLSVGRLGEVSLFVFPRDQRPPYDPLDVAMAVSDAQEHHINAHADPPIATNEPVSPPTNTKPPGEQQPSPEKQERLVLTGRAGRDPRVAETKTGVTFAKFPLAVHETSPETGEELTNWFTVVAFRGLAETVAETVKRGERYKVVGYVHEREGRDGRKVTEIYAATVKPPRRSASERQRP